MKYYFLFLLGIVLSFGSIQADLPPGSYQGSCHNCRVVNNNILSCLCSYPMTESVETKGNIIYNNNETYLDLASGTGDIANCFGVLKYGVCEGDVAWKPKGSYTNSCKDCVIVNVPGSQQDVVLWCSCKIYDQGWDVRKPPTAYIKSGLLLNPRMTATTDIANCSGSLVYGSCNGVMPSGSYQASCTPSVWDYKYPCFMTSTMQPTDTAWKSWKQVYSLQCNCKNRAGDWVATSLDVDLRSSKQINNCNGQLC